MLDIKNLGDYLLTPTGLITVGVIIGFWLLLGAASAIGARGRKQLDPQRLFTTEQRRQIFALCRHRCEHKSPVWFRCRRPATHADHVYPHSQGGSTTLSNGQGLCQFHNLSKGAKMPGRLYRSRLARRRRRYYPPGAPRKVTWQRKAATIR